MFEWRVSLFLLALGRLVARSDDLDVVQVKRFQTTALAAVVQPLTPRTAILQYLFNEGVAETGALSGNAHELTLGGRFRVSERLAVEFALLENLLNYSNGPDFGIHLGMVTTSR